MQPVEQRKPQITLNGQVLTWLIFFLTNGHTFFLITTFILKLCLNFKQLSVPSKLNHPIDCMLAGAFEHFVLRVVAAWGEIGDEQQYPKKLDLSVVRPAAVPSS